MHVERSVYIHDYRKSATASPFPHPPDDQRQSINTNAKGEGLQSLAAEEKLGWYRAHSITTHISG